MPVYFYTDSSVLNFLYGEILKKFEKKYYLGSPDVKSTRHKHQTEFSCAFQGAIVPSIG